MAKDECEEESGETMISVAMALIFSLLCWLLWKNRCKGVMEGTRLQARELINQGRYRMMEEVIAGKIKHRVFRDQGKTILSGSLHQVTM